jgi:hypothetical protein
VPDITGLSADDIGLGRQRSKADGAPPLNEVDALQQQYDLQRALSAAPIVNRFTTPPF